MIQARPDDSLDQGEYKAKAIPYKAEKKQNHNHKADFCGVLSPYHVPGCMLKI